MDGETRDADSGFPVGGDVVERSSSAGAVSRKGPWLYGQMYVTAGPKWESPYHIHRRQRNNPSASLVGAHCGLLVDAILAGDRQKAQGLVFAGVSLDGADDEGNTVLHLAINQGFGGLCRLLVTHKVDLNAANAQSVTGMHMAALRGETVVLRRLLESRAHMDVQNSSGDTPLSLCAMQGHLDSLKVLLKARAQVDLASDQQSLDALVESCQKPKEQQSAVVEQRPRGASGTSPLLRALQSNAQHELVTELLQARADANAADQRLNQPLHIACHYGSIIITRKLLAQRADPECLNDQLRTPLHFAAGCGAQRIVKMLVEHQARVNVPDRNRVLPIQLAADPVTEQQLRSLGAHDASVPASVRVVSPPLSPSVRPGGDKLPSRGDKLSSRSPSRTRLKS